MAIPFTDVFLNQEQRINDTNINIILNRLLENDKNIANIDKYNPKTWLRKWFYNDDEPGYRKGDSVWINTEDIDQFVQNNYDTIYIYASKRSELALIIQPYSNDEKIHKMYCDIVKGYKYTDDITLPSLYYLGDLSGHSQIKISLKDNNKDEPNVTSSWADYYIRDFEQISSDLSTEIIGAIDEHNESYHFHNETDVIDFDSYADKNLSNVTDIVYKPVITDGTAYGIDYLISCNNYVKDELPNKSQEYKLSNYTQTTTSVLYTLKELSDNCHYVLRNALSTTSDIKDKLSAFNNYKTEQVEYFANQITANSNLGFGDINFYLLSAVGNGYPAYISYSLSNYNSIKDIRAKYSVSYKVLPLSGFYSEISANISYYDYVEDNILSTYISSDIKDMTKYKQENVQFTQNIEGEKIVLSTLNAYKNQNSLIVWKSKYCEQNGLVLSANGETKIDFKEIFEEDYVLNVTPQLLSDDDFVEIRVVERNLSGFTCESSLSNFNFSWSAKGYIK